jgi:hypothetical protein
LGDSTSGVGWCVCHAIAMNKLHHSAKNQHTAEKKEETLVEIDQQMKLGDMEVHARHSKLVVKLPEGKNR